MRRRDFLGVSAVTTIGAIAGCTGSGDGGGDGDGDGDGDGGETTTDSGTTTTQTQGRGSAGIENPPDAVYVPTHVEGMQMAGMDMQGPYKCALTYTFPHRFWLVTGTTLEAVPINENDAVHMMPVVWDKEAGVVPPDVNPTVTVSQDGEQVTQFSAWPMVSQRMGFHFGDNVQLPGAGTYQTTVEIGQPSSKRTGAFADREYGAATFEFEFEFGPDKMNSIMYRDIPKDQEGTRGAASPMNMEMMPTPQLPEQESMPGTVHGTATSGDAGFVVTTFDDATPFGGTEDQTYLAVSPRTPYNRYPLPLMSLSGTLNRAGNSVFDDFLLEAVDPDLNVHYGALVSGVESGDELTITVDAPPQVARHVGYETAFLDMPEMTVPL